MLFFAALISVFFALSCENIEPNNTEISNGEEQTPNDEEQNEEEDNIIVDWAPIVLYVYLNDAEGNSLFEPTNDNITLTYEGDEYKVANYLSSDTPQAQTLEYMAVFEGGYVTRKADGTAFMIIGEWNRNQNWEMCTIEINWGDGTTDTLAFTHSYTYDSEYRNDAEHNWGYTFSSQFFLNGEPNPNNEFYIVK